MTDDVLKRVKSINAAFEKLKDIHSPSVLCEMISGFMDTAAYIFDEKGKILAAAGTRSGMSSVPEKGIKLLYEITDIQIIREDGAFLVLCPLLTGDARHGGFILCGTQAFSDGEIILLEIIRAIMTVALSGMARYKRDKEEAGREAIKSALGNLSYSELEAVIHISRELMDHDGIVVAGKIAQYLGIANSVVVNALKKLQTAGIAEARSLGSKGTYIRILNPSFYDEIKKL